MEHIFEDGVLFNRGFAQFLSRTAGPATCRLPQIHNRGLLLSISRVKDASQSVRSGEQPVQFRRSSALLKRKDPLLASSGHLKVSVGLSKVQLSVVEDIDPLRWTNYGSRHSGQSIATGEMRKVITKKNEQSQRNEMRQSKFTDPRRNSKDSNIFKCNKCDMTAADRHKLRRHIMRVHEKVKPFPCRACDMKFCVRHERDRHEYAKHENVGSFQCPKCPETFCRKYLYEKHMRSVHSEEVNKPCCPGCGQEFASNALLIGHKRSTNCEANTE